MKLRSRRCLSTFTQWINRSGPRNDQHQITLEHSCNGIPQPFTFRQLRWPYVTLRDSQSLILCRQSTAFTNASHVSISINRNILSNFHAFLNLFPFTAIVRPKPPTMFHFSLMTHKGRTSLPPHSTRPMRSAATTPARQFFNYEEIASESLSTMQNYRTPEQCESHANLIRRNPDDEIGVSQKTQLRIVHGNRPNW